MGWPLRFVLGGGLLLLAKQAFAKTGASENRTLTEDMRLRFVETLYLAIARAWPTSSVATRQLVLSVGSLESGYGVSTAYRLGNNAFNIIQGSANVPSIQGPDQDCSSGVCKPITQKFRAYATLDDSISDFLSLMRGSRYREAYALLIAGDIGFPEALGRAGYYTLPISAYVSNFRGVLAGVRKRLGSLQLLA